MSLFEKKLDDYSDTTSGISVEEIKPGQGNGDLMDEESNIRVLDGGIYTDENGKPYSATKIRVIANIKLSRRGKRKKVMMLIDLSTRAMQEAIDQCKDDNRYAYERREKKIEMKKPTKKVIQTASKIISEGVEGYQSNVGKDGSPSESDLLKAERLLYDFIILYEKKMEEEN